MLKDFGFGMISGLDSKVVDMINAHPLIIIGSCDRALVPAASRAFGARVKDGGKALEVLVSHVLSQQTIANIQDTRRIAATFVQPETYESYQFKGRLTSCDEPDEDDWKLSAEYCQTISCRLGAIGAPANVVYLIFISRNVMRVRFDIEEAYVQTPGKISGQRL
jgi:hypothetical protein